MPEDPVIQRIQHLRAVKSAFLLEAQSLDGRGLTPYSRPLYLSAADAELELAELLEAHDRDHDARISLLSAASCLVRVGQFQKAVPLLERLAGTFPEAESLLAQCRGKPDQPFEADTPTLRALIGLLLQKGLITTEEWARALEGV